MVLLSVVKAFLFVVVFSFLYDRVLSGICSTNSESESEQFDDVLNEPGIAIFFSLLPHFRKFRFSLLRHSSFNHQHAATYAPYRAPPFDLLQSLLLSLRSRSTPLQFESFLHLDQTPPLQVYQDHEEISTCLSRTQEGRRFEFGSKCFDCWQRLGLE